MTEKDRAEAAIKNILSILKAWKDGRIKVTTEEADMINSIYDINTIMKVIENNALEGITPPTKIIEREDKKYEILITISDI